MHRPMLAVFAALLLAGWLAGCNSATPTPKDVTSCDKAFSAAVAVSTIGEASERAGDLDEAIRSCELTVDFVEAAGTHPGAIPAGVDPLQYLADRCKAAPDLTQLKICQAAIGMTLPK